MESNKRKKTKMTIEQAIVQLLKEKSFEYISTVELAKTAGISRSSFYTHYKDKYDLIERYQQGLFQKLETIFEEYYNDRQQAILKVLDFLESEPLFSALLSENGTKEIQTFLRHKFQMMLHQELQERFNNKEFSQIEKEYNSVYLTNALFGVVQMWIARGKKESPQQMTDFLLKMLGYGISYSAKDRLKISMLLVFVHAFIALDSSTNYTKSFDQLVNSLSGLLAFLRLF